VSAVALSARLQRVLDWLLEGYPTGVPPQDYIPVLALLGQRLTEDEVRQVAVEIAEHGRDAGADRAEVEGDIGVRITSITDALPRSEEVARVRAQLASAHDWPLEG